MARALGRRQRARGAKKYRPEDNFRGGRRRPLARAHAPSITASAPPLWMCPLASRGKVAQESCQVAALGVSLLRGGRCAAVAPPLAAPLAHPGPFGVLSARWPRRAAHPRVRHAAPGAMADVSTLKSEIEKHIQRLNDTESLQVTAEKSVKAKTTIVKRTHDQWEDLSPHHLTSKGL